MNVEMKTTQMRTKRDCLFYACCNKAVSHYHFHLADSRAVKGVGKLQVKKGVGGRFQICSDLKVLAWGSWKQTN